jgi:thiol-disulfide isomerase/thioredoxin
MELMPHALKSLAWSCIAAFSLVVATTSRASGPQGSPQSAAPKSASKQPVQQKPPTPDDELQQTIDNAGNDRAALVRNLEAFLKKYPEAPQRVKIYRALVEATLQLRDAPRAADYAERLVALAPEDISMTLLAIQLLERNGDEAGLRRATSYATHVLEYIDSTNDEKSPKISREDWETNKNHDRMTVLLLRGRLYLKLHETARAQKDFEESYAFDPGVAAAEKLGEIAELNKDLPAAIQQYARAFALSDKSKNAPDRRETRQRLGNVWRLAHGSDDGLGDYVLRTYDELNATPPKANAARNGGAKEPFDFTLRRVPDGSALSLANEKGKILVVNFWATWCGPCRALEPQFDRVALGFHQNHDVLFLAADCDEDETLVPPYVKEVKPQATVVFADGLDRLLAVNSFPTVVIIDRVGKIVYRAEGYGEDTFEQSLTAAIQQALSPDAGPAHSSTNR